LAKLLDKITGRKKDKPDAPFKKLKSEVDKIFTNTKGVRDRMDRALRYYKGEWWNPRVMKDSDSRVFANFLFSTVQSIAPLLTDNRPVWSVRARKPHMQNYVDAYSLALEYLWDKLDMDQVTLKWIIDALLMKVGLVKCYWNPDEDEVEVENVDPRTFFIAPGYADLWDSPMCGVRVERPLSWIRMKFPDTGAEVKSEDTSDAEGINMETAEGFELEMHTVLVYEVWLKDSTMEEYFVDPDGNEVPHNQGGENKEKESRKKYPNGRVLTFTAKTLLADQPAAYDHGKPPYVALYDYLTPHDFYGISEGDQIEELVKSFNRNLQLFDNWTRDYCDPPWLMDENSGLEYEKTKEMLKTGGSLFSVSMINNPEPLKKVKTEPIDPTVVQMMSGTTKLIEEISGVTDISKGMAMKAQRQSATEISTLIESAYTRTRQRVRNYEHSIKRLEYLKLHLMQQFYTEPRTFSVRRDENVNYYNVQNSPEFAMGSIGRPNEDMEEEELKQLEDDYTALIEDLGDVDQVFAAFDLEVDTNSSLPMDKQSLANLFLRLLETAQANPATAIPMWEAVLTQLRVPRYKKLIAEIKRLTTEQQQAQQPQQAPPMGGGAPNPLQILRGGGSNVGPATAGAEPGVPGA
jgi:hypothetical protein